MLRHLCARTSAILLALSTAATQAPTQFRAHAVSGPATQRAAALAVADLDGDGDADLLLTTPTGLTQLINNGTAQFAARACPAPGLQFGGEVHTTDLDGDGDLDALVIPSNLADALYFINDGGGGLTASNAGLPGSPHHRSLLADFDGDGDADLMLLPVFSSASLFVRTQQTFALAPNAIPALLAVVPSTVCAFDPDRDGDLDVVSGDGTTIKYFVNDGNGVFSDGTSRFRQAPQPRAVVAGDFTGDGLQDLVTSSLAGNQLFAGLGDGTFPTSSPLGISTPLEDIVAFDADEDGDLDIVGAVVAVGSGPALALWLNDGSGQFVDATATRFDSPPAAATRVAAADLDYDGDLDLASVANGTTGAATTTWFANHHRHVSVPTQPTLGGELRIECSMRPGYQTGLGLALVAIGPPAARTAPTPFGPLFLGPSAVSLPAVTMLPGRGEGEVRLGVPLDPSLRNVEARVQALMLEPLGGGRPRLTGFARVWVQ